MRVLIKKSKNRSINHIFDGMARVMIRAGIAQPISWDSRVKPPFDAFDELSPDMFLVSTYDITDSDVKCLNQYRECIYVLHEQYPANNVVDARRGVKPDLVFSTAKESDNLCLPCAVDALDISPVNNLVALSISSIVESATELKYLMPFCSPERNPNLSVFAEQDLGIPQYFGSHIGNEPSIYARSAMSVIFSDRHESNHKLYDCIKYGGLPITSYNTTDQAALNSLFGTFQNTDDISKWIEYYSNYPAHRQSAIEALRKHCSEHHTYYHRAYQLFDAIGLHNEASKIEGLK